MEKIKGMDRKVLLLYVGVAMFIAGLLMVIINAGTRDPTTIWNEEARAAAYVSLTVFYIGIVVLIVGILLIVYILYQRTK